MNRTSLVPPVRRTLAAAAVTSLLAAGLVGCGDKGGNDAAPAAASTSPSSSAGASAGAGTDTPAAAGLKAGESVSPADFGALMKTGLAASTTAHTTMSMDVGAMGKLTGTGEVDFTTDPAEMALTMTMPAAGSSTMEVRLVDGLLYLSMGDLTGGKFWKVDPKDPSGPLGSMGLGSMMDQMAPGHMLVGAEDSIRRVTYVGADDVSGRRLDHYRVTVETAGIMHAMGDAMRGPAAGALPKTLTYDLWLDDQHRLGQMTMDMPVAGNPVSMRMELTDWGGAVHIVAPPADQVTDPSRISG